MIRKRQSVWLLSPDSRHYVSTMPVRRHPYSRPWVLIEHSESFSVDAANGTHLGSFYFEDEPVRRAIMHRMTKEEARRIAQSFMRLPEMLEELAQLHARRDDPA